MNAVPRTAVREDAAGIAALSGQLGYPTTPAVMERRLCALLEQPENVVLVLADQRDILGWVHAVYCRRLESGTFVEIAGLVVDEIYRGSGIGRMLVEEVIVWSRRKNCYDLRVRSNVIRTKSHPFYLSMGFVEMKEQKVFGMNFQ